MLVNRIQEQGLNIEVILGGHFHELVAYFRSSLHPFLSRDLLFNLSTLVGNQPLRTFLFSIPLLNGLNLFMHFLKRLNILAIVHQEEDRSSPIESTGNASEFILT